MNLHLKRFNKVPINQNQETNPLPEPPTVLRFYCKGCGVYFESYNDAIQSFHVNCEAPAICACEVIEK